MDSITNPAGSSAGKRTYDAFGRIDTTSGTWTGPFGYGGAYGYQEDASGLKMVGHRWYDAEVGRFLTRDPAKSGSNWYAYCGNDPVGGVDPEGKFVFVIPIFFVVGMVIGGATAWWWGQASRRKPRAKPYPRDIPWSTPVPMPPPGPQPLYRAVEPPEDQDLRQSGGIAGMSDKQEFGKSFWTSPQDAHQYAVKRRGGPFVIWGWPNPKGLAIL